MNRNYLYNVGYYEGLVTRATEYKQKNNDMLLATYRQSDEEIALTEQSFVLETVYPGLLVGVGYPHMAGGNGEDKAEEIKVGFSLDYVNGLPYIPGSGTKGFLRSVFRRYPEYIMQTLGIDDMEIVKALETELFETGSDVFLDVYPVRPGADGKLLAADYITSHLTEKEEMDGLVEPVPIKMMKILPGVQLLFRFLLKDSVLVAEDYRCLKDDVFMSKEVKMELFQQILENFGLGAKTNTGYGRLKESDTTTKVYKWLAVTEETDRVVVVTPSEGGFVRKAAAPEKGSKDDATCPCCKKNKRTVKDGRMFALCFECSKKAPVCKQCGQKKVTWNVKKDAWNPACFDCFGKGRERN